MFRRIYKSEDYVDPTIEGNIAYVEASSQDENWLKLNFSKFVVYENIFEKFGYKKMTAHC